jgi:hypothetical protein
MRKNGLLFSVALIVLTMALVPWVGGRERATMADGPQIGSIPESAHKVSLPLVMGRFGNSEISPFGITMYGEVSDSAGLPEMQQAGASWITTFLYWSRIEPSKGSFDWSDFDVKAQNAQAAGMSPFVVFTANPTWAAPLPAGPVNNIQDLVNFTSKMAERYDCDGQQDAPGNPCVHYYSFYPEPDNGDEYHAQQRKGYWGHNGAGYADMLSKVAPAIRQADPNAKVFIGGLAYDWFEEEGGPFVRSFLADTLQALDSKGGVEKYIDGATFHYYPISPDKWPSLREKAAEIRGIMTSNGAGNLSLFCPETGYWSSHLHGSSEKKQAEWLVRNYTRGLAEGIKIISYYKVFDTVVAGDPDDLYPDRTSGLLRVDRSKKPAYYAYETLVRELGPVRYDRPFQADGVEGYVFRMPDGREKTVLWSTAGTQHVSLPYSRVGVVTLLGQEQTIGGGQQASGGLEPGAPNRVWIELRENEPVYVEPW